MADNMVNLPSGYGGLTRFSQEYETRFKLKPAHIIGFVVLIVAFRIALGIFLK
ncbi:Uncharacterised protein [uncultured archaeon]|nr:Uncharacterised protein [uncultured archaeon]